MICSLGFNFDIWIVSYNQSSNNFYQWLMWDHCWSDIALLIMNERIWDHCFPVLCHIGVFNPCFGSGFSVFPSFDWWKNGIQTKTKFTMDGLVQFRFWFGFGCYSNISLIFNETLVLYRFFLFRYRESWIRLNHIKISISVRNRSVYPDWTCAEIIVFFCNFASFFPCLHIILHCFVSNKVMFMLNFNHV